jgi:hypothetical protein
LKNQIINFQLKSEGLLPSLFGQVIYVKLAREQKRKRIKNLTEHKKPAKNQLFLAGY